MTLRCLIFSFLNLLSLCFAMRNYFKSFLQLIFNYWMHNKISNLIIHTLFFNFNHWNSHPYTHQNLVYDVKMGNWEFISWHKHTRTLLCLTHSQYVYVYKYNKCYYFFMWAWVKLNVKIEIFTLFFKSHEYVNMHLKYYKIDFLRWTFLKKNLMYTGRQFKDARECVKNFKCFYRLKNNPS